AAACRTRRTAPCAVSWSGRDSGLTSTAATAGPRASAPAGCRGRWRARGSRGALARGRRLPRIALAEHQHVLVRLCHFPGGVELLGDAHTRAANGRSEDRFVVK